MSPKDQLAFANDLKETVQLLMVVGPTSANLLEMVTYLLQVTDLMLAFDGHATNRHQAIVRDAMANYVKAGVSSSD